MLELKPGDCLLIDTNREAGRIIAHLFVIILETQSHTRNTIIVNVQSDRGGRSVDRTVVLHRGDYEFIQHDSYVNYSLAKIVSVDDLEQLLSAGTARMRPAVTQEVFQHIADGILRSPFTPLEVKEMVRDHLFSQL